MITLPVAVLDGPAEWLTAIGTLALALATVIAVLVSIRTTRTDRDRADAQRRADADAIEKRLHDERRQRADQDARQVIVEFLSGGPRSTPGSEVFDPADGITHRIIVTAPASYQIKNVDARMADQSNSGFSTFGTGWSFEPAEFADGLVRHRCSVSLNAQQRGATPVVRFTDPNGWQYYWYRGQTRRFGQSIDFHEAAAEIDKWVHRGPEADDPAT